jgi:hypothetical protein
MTARRPGAWSWLAVLPVLVVVAVVVLVSNRATAFSGDDLSYYVRNVLVAPHSFRHFDSMGLEYLFIPHNGPIGGHLQVAGKLVYEALFAIFGANYVPFRIVAVLAVLACVALLFEAVRRRLGTPAGIIAALWLGLLGAAWEVLLWPFDMHTSLACAAGIGALLALESDRRYADALACALLVLAVAFVEVGLVFTVAAGATVLLGSRPLRRSWIFAVPLALYAVWFAWSRHYGFPVGGGGLGDLLPSIFHSLEAVLGALVGAIPTGAGASVPQVEPNAIGTVLAIAALALLAALIVARRIRRTTWPLLAGLATYWLLIALGDREPDASRYVFAGAVLVLLIAADLLRGRRPGPIALLPVAALLAISTISGLAKLGDGGGYLRADAMLTRNEFAMLELAGDRGDPDYLSVTDPHARAVGGSPYLVMTTAQYLSSAADRGSLAASLDEVRASNFFIRKVDDVVLADALGLGLTPASPPASVAGCRRLSSATGSTVLPDSGALVRADGAPANLAIGRFYAEGPARQLGQAQPGTWVRLALDGPDAAPEPWQLYADAAVTVCPLD